MDRTGDDVQILRWYQEAGFTGCVLKGHYDATAGRAHATGKGLGMRVYGGLALNQHVGGLNPAAVRAALAMGARMIWMPTADAHTEKSAGLPRLCSASNGLSDVTYAIPPVDWSVAEPVEQILTFIAEADAVLATGHLSTAEITWLLPVARAAGVGRVLLTRPSYTVPAMSPTAAAELTSRGAYAEVTAYQLLHQPECDATRLAAFIREVGYRRIILSSDDAMEGYDEGGRRRYRLRAGLSADGVVQEYAVRGPDGVRFLQLGKARGARWNNASAHAAFQRVIDELPVQGWHVVGDLPAGTRQAFQGWSRYATTLVVVVEPTAASILSGRRLARLANMSTAPRVLLVASQVRQPADAQDVAARTGLPLVGSVPFDPLLREAARGSTRATPDRAGLRSPCAVAEDGGFEPPRA